ncbi:ABC transporter substrate-binding protein [Paenibacillus piri]|uniref:Sugar ABC transporter substrate-binding protein n=1 Tax=Paenibacillus piri TaxID=2547395 RepID=A0A4R5KCC9_9BACL|nr:sugar ABC transporter substrate-binding protein [Paenibacillus piri]TDF92522.1 sugar ABC transporter substrate-binding protein [Paenibacillus piri]
MNKRAMALCASIVMLLTACSSTPAATSTTNSGDKQQPAEAKADPNKKVTIKYSFWGDTDTKNLHIAVIDEFMKRNPNITVEPVYIPADYLTKIQTSFTGGTQPDLINFTANDLISFAASGVLEPQTKWIKQEWDKENFGDIFERLMKALEYNGEQWALPRNSAGRTLFYNKRIFDEAGVKYPDSSWTWDTLIEQGKKLTNNSTDPNKKIYAIGFQGEVSDISASYIWQAGGDYLSPDGKKFIFNSNESKQALKYLHDLIYVHKIAPNPSNYTNAVPSAMFLNEKVAMHYDAGSFIATMQKAKFPWDIALFPEGPKGRDGALSPTGLAIPKASKNKEAAWQLAKFINGPVGQEILISTGFSAPVRKSILNDEKKYLPPDKFKVNRKVALEAYTDHARVKPNHPAWVQMDTIIKKYLGLYFLDPNGKLDDAMKQIDNEVNPVLAK